MKIGFGKKIKFYQKSKKIIGLFVFLIFIIFVLNFTGYSKNIKSFFFFISSPIQKTFWLAGNKLSNFFAAILEAKVLKKELNSLYLKNQELLSRTVRMLEIEKENQVLREALGLGLEKEFKLMLARVISKDASQDSILINKGEKDGVLEGLPVIMGEKILLGRVGQVYDNFSEVILISNKKSFFDAKIITFSADLENHFVQADSETYGMARGKGNLNLELDLIPKEKEIFEGDLVVTSLVGGVYPQGLLVGRIKKVRSLDAEVFQKAEIDPVFKIGHLDYLFIIKEF